MFQLSVIWSPDAATKDQLDRIEAALQTVIGKEIAMAGELQDLKDEVAQEKDVMTRATVLINGFAARLQAAIDAAVAAGGSAAEFVQLKTDLDAAGKDLAAAVAAQTPVGPPTP